MTQSPTNLSATLERKYPASAPSVLPRTHEISVAMIRRPAVHGRAFWMITMTGVGKAESDGPKSPTSTRPQKVKYCSSRLPSVP